MRDRIMRGMQTWLRRISMWRCLGIASLVIIAATAWPNFNRAPAATIVSPGDHSLLLLSPRTAGAATHNQLNAAAPADLSISDESAEVRPGLRTITGIAKGMKNVALIVPAGGVWSMAEPTENGAFAANVTIPDEAGPLPVEVIAWNSPPNDPHYTVELKARVVLFVSKGKPGSVPSVAPAGHPAAGMSLAWSDDFIAPLSLSSSKTRDATWFAGGKPSASGSQYSDAAFVRSDDPRKPFFQKEGFLRIRATNDPGMTDPAGWHRTWWSGHLSTGFPDGSASIEFREGYAEIRMMIPEGQGPWPAFWLLDSANSPPKPPYGAVEIDVMEGYGHDRSGYMATMHRWPGGDPTEPHASAEKRIPLAGHPDTFHTYGVRLTRTEVVWYLDGIEVQRGPLYRADMVSSFYLMTDLAMGGGWPVSAPPSGYYDLWIDYVAVYR